MLQTPPHIAHTHTMKFASKPPTRARACVHDAQIDCFMTMDFNMRVTFEVSTVRPLSCAYICVETRARDFCAMCAQNCVRCTPHHKHKVPIVYIYGYSLLTRGAGAQYNCMHTFCCILRVFMRWFRLNVYTIHIILCFQVLYIIFVAFR